MKKVLLSMAIIASLMFVASCKNNTKANEAETECTECTECTGECTECSGECENCEQCDSTACEAAEVPAETAE